MRVSFTGRQSFWAIAADFTVVIITLLFVVHASIATGQVQVTKPAAVVKSTSCSSGTMISPLYVPEWNKVVYGFASGTLGTSDTSLTDRKHIAKTATTGFLMSQLTVADDGRVVTVSTTGELCFLDRNCEIEIISTKIPCNTMCNVLRLRNGRIVYGNDNGPLVVITTAGVVVHRMESQGKAYVRGGDFRSGILLTDSTFIYTDLQGYVYFLDESLTQWAPSLKLSGGIAAEPAFDPSDSTYVVCTTAGEVVRIGRTGLILNRKTITGENIVRSAAISPQSGVLMIATKQGKIFFLSRAFEVLRSEDRKAECLGIPSYLPNGIFALGANDNKLVFYSDVGEVVTELEVNGGSAGRVVPLPSGRAVVSVNMNDGRKGAFLLIDLPTIER